MTPSVVVVTDESDVHAKATCSILQSEFGVKAAVGRVHPDGDGDGGTLELGADDGELDGGGLAAGGTVMLWV